MSTAVLCIKLSASVASLSNVYGQLLLSVYFVFHITPHILAFCISYVNSQFIICDQTCGLKLIIFLHFNHTTDQSILADRLIVPCMKQLLTFHQAHIVF